MADVVAVVAVEVSETDLRPLLADVEAAGGVEVVVAPAAGEDVADHLAGVLDPDTLVVVTGTDRGVEIAVATHALVPDAAVVILAGDVDEREELSATLSITPGISPHTLCVVADDPATPATVTEEIDRARLRAAYRKTVARLPIGAPGGGIPWEQLTQYLGQLFDHAPLGILVVDRRGVIHAANPGTADILGWPPHQTVGSAFPSMFRGTNGALAGDLMTDCLTTGEPAMESLTRTGPDGAVQHLEVTVTPVDPERELGVFVLLRDETARVRAMEASERARASAEAVADRYAGLAWTLQESLLPPALPEIPGAEVAARFHPAGDGSEIGGDFYDVFPVRDDEWFAVTGDVCGKGAGAARLTALTRYTLRATTVRSPEVERNLSDLNATLAQQYELDRERDEHRFVTAVAARLCMDDEGIAVHAGSGGHPPPLVVRAGGDVETADCRGSLLGVFETGRWTVTELRLSPGDVLITYTDGVTEARRNGQEFGEERLVELLGTLAGRTADEVVAAVEDAVLRFQAGDARDDIAVLAVRAACP